MQLRFLPLLGFLHLLPFASVWSGWIIEGKQQQEQSPTVSQTTYLDAAGLRVESPDGLVIFQSAEKKLIIADTDQKTYQVMDRDTLKKMTSGLGAAMKQMQEAMAGMNAEQKAMMEKMMGNQSFPMGGTAPSTQPAVTTYKKLADGVSVGTWTADHYEVLENGTKGSEIWVASPSALPIDRDLLKLFAEMGDFFKDLLSALPPGAGAGNDVMSFDLPGEGAPSGIPVKEVVYKNGVATSSWEISRATPAEIPADKFRIPSGYEEKSPFLSEP
jgi:hypothetical protein